MWRGLLVLAVMALAGCGGGGSAASSAGPTRTPDDTTGTPNVIELPAPAGTEQGRGVATRAGCLACHLIGEQGNDGPGQDLTHVGARLDRAELEAVLRTPDAPMPSFKDLRPADFDALVDYMTALR